MSDQKTKRRTVTDLDVCQLSNGHPITVTIVDNCGTIEMHLSVEGSEKSFNKVFQVDPDADFMESMRHLIKVATTQ